MRSLRERPLEVAGGLSGLPSGEMGKQAAPRPESRMYANGLPEMAAPALVCGVGGSYLRYRPNFRRRMAHFELGGDWPIRGDDPPRMYMRAPPPTEIGRGSKFIFLVRRVSRGVPRRACSSAGGRVPF